MIATAVASVAGMASGGRWGTAAVLEVLTFRPADLLALELWSPVTYLFVEVDPLNLLLHEVFGLWVFASPLERQWGSRRFLLYFFATGVGAALLTSLFALVAGSLLPLTLRGTWVAAEAILLAWVLSHWDGTVFLLVFPVPAPYLLVLALGVPALYVILGAWEPFVPVLVGMGLGYLMLDKRRLSLRRLGLHLRAWWIDRQLRRKARHLHVVPPPSKRNGKGEYLH
jgi:membrane associated rhomboid family serine protease